MLHNFQSAFTALMLDHPDALKNPPPEFSAQFESGQIPLGTRLSVYRNNIVGSLTDIMLESFPLILKLVGKDFLEGMARAFILQNPPKASCLNTFGEGFGEFIDGFEPARALPYLADIARLEIALNRAYYARDEESLKAEHLAALAPDDLENLVLTLKESVTLMGSPFPLTQIRALCLDEAAQQPDMGAGEILMISRMADTPEIVRLEADEYHLLRAKKPLGAATAETLERYPAFDFAKFLQKHLHLETFSQSPANRDA